MNNTKTNVSTSNDSINKIKFLQHNIRSLKNKLDEIVAFTELHDLDFLLLSETWLSDSDSDVAKSFKDYNFFLENSHNGYKGVAVIAKKCFNCKKVNVNLNLEKIDIIIIHYITENLYLGSIYVPEYNDRILNNDLKKILDFFQGKKFFLCGDFNAHHTEYGSSVSNHRGELFKDTIEDHTFLVLNNGSPTRLTKINQNISAIDLTICDPQTFNNTEWKVENETFRSDHLVIRFDLLSTTHKRPKIRKVKIVNSSKILEELNGNYNSLSDFQKAVIKITNKNTTMKVTKNKPKYWWTNEIQQKIALRKKLYYEFRVLKKLEHFDMREPIRQSNRMVSRKEIFF
jgi:exonuclease III